MNEVSSTPHVKSPPPIAPHKEIPMASKQELRAAAQRLGAGELCYVDNCAFPSWMALKGVSPHDQWENIGSDADLAMALLKALWKAGEACVLGANSVGYYREFDSAMQHIEHDGKIVLPAILAANLKLTEASHVK